MGRLWCLLLAALLACLVLVSTTDEKLSCFFGEEICNQWLDNDNASHGNYNGMKFCCPPEPDQRLTLTGFPPDEDTCTCNSGTAADWAHITTAAPAGAGDDYSAASIVTPHHLLSAMILMIAGILLY